MPDLLSHFKLAASAGGEGATAGPLFPCVFNLFFFLTQLLTLPDHKTMAENLVLEKYCVQLTPCSFSLADVEI